jgi:transposase
MDSCPGAFESRDRQWGMYTGKLVFSQVMEHLPIHEFQKCVARYGGDYKSRGFSCRDQFLCMSFAQLTFRESLRDIEACLRSVPEKLYHLGFRGRIARSTLADANEIRDWRIYADFAQSLIHIARPMYASDPLGVDLDATVYALDSTTIDLCLSVFPWAHFRDQKAAVKMHTLLDLRGSIPTFIEVSDGKRHDVNLLDEIVAEPGAFYVMDRAYLDFKRLHAFHRSGAFFVTRTKTGVVLNRRYSHAVPPDTGVTSDQTVVLGTSGSTRNYPDTLRRVRFVDPEQGRRLIFLTNNFELPALTIAQLYKSRWRIELFFKWIKQHLRIKAFYGSSENAVKTQIWIAVASYVVIAILKKRLLLSASLHEILQVLSLNLFEKTPILQACGESQSHEKSGVISNQLNLLDL